MLKQRIITAVFLIPLTVVILCYLPAAAFLLLTSMMVLIGAWEWAALMGLHETKQRVGYLALMLLFLILGLFTPVHRVLVCAGVGWLIALALLIPYPRGSAYWGGSLVCKALMGIFVLIPCWAAINFIRNSQVNGVYLLLFLFILIWGADSAAYFVGRKWGKHQLAPRLSPGKSIEGVGGAIIFSEGIMLLGLWLGHISAAIWPWAILLAFVTVLFSVVGDLFESMMKRQAGVKDSGHVFPGHGGLLDRIDSLTAAAPIFTLGLFLIGTYLKQ